MFTFRRPHLALFAAMAMPMAATALPDLTTEQLIDCPRILAADALSVSNTPPGWSAHIPRGLRLNFAGPMVGPPSAMGMVKGETLDSSDGMHTVKWTFDEQPQAEGKWMACLYGHAYTVVLSKRIDDRATACAVSYAKNDYGFQDLAIRCTW